MRSKKMGKCRIIVFVVLACCGCVKQHNTSEVLTHSEAKPLWDDLARVDVCYEEKDRTKLQEAIQILWIRLKRLEWQLSSTDPRSDVTRLNNADNEPIEVSQDTYQLIKKVKEFSLFTVGMFDITAKPLIDLFRAAEIKGRYPADEEIRSLRKYVGEKYVELLPGNRIRITNPGTKIDLVEVAKGYAVDEAARVLKEHGFFNFFVVFGRNHYGGGKNCHGNPWQVKIRNSAESKGGYESVLLTDAAISIINSKLKGQYFLINNEKDSKVISLFDGQLERISGRGRMPPVLAVIAPKAFYAESLAIGCYAGQILKYRHERLDFTELISSYGKDYALLLVIRKYKDRVIKYKSRFWKNYEKNI